MYVGSLLEVVSRDTKFQRRMAANAEINRRAGTKGFTGSSYAINNARNSMEDKGRTDQTSVMNRSLKNRMNNFASRNSTTPGIHNRINANAQNPGSMQKQASLPIMKWNKK